MWTHHLSRRLPSFGDVPRDGSPSVPSTHRPSTSAELAAHGELRRADRLDRESLTVSALGSSVAGFGLVDGARLIGETIRDYDPGTLADARFVGDGEEAETIRRAVE